MLNIQYFASVRESLDKDSEQIELPAGVTTVGELMRHLGARDPAFKSLVEAENRVLVAVNQTVVDGGCVLAEGDEVAFFPPMTGG